METRQNSLGRKLELTGATTNGRNPGRGEATHCGFCGVDLDAAKPVARRFGEGFCNEAHAEAFVSEVRAARTRAAASPGPAVTDREGTAEQGEDQPAAGHWDLKRALVLAACVGLPILAVGVLAGGGGALLGAGAAILPVLALLACPLGMFFMMRGMANHGKGESGGERPQRSNDDRH